MPVAICYPDTTSRKLTGQLSFGSTPPTDLLPFRIGQHQFGRDGNIIGHVVFAPPSGRGFREYQPNISSIYILASRYADSPEQVALAQGFAEWPTRSITSIGEHTAKASTRGDNAVNGTVRNFVCGRAVRARGHFPSDDAATKLLYLILNRSEKEWRMPPREWSMAKAQFAVLFGERFIKAMAA